MSPKGLMVVIVPAVAIVAFWVMVLSDLVRRPALDGLPMLAAVILLIGVFFSLRSRHLGSTVFRRLAALRFWVDAGERSFQLLYLVIGLEMVGASVAILLVLRR